MRYSSFLLQVALVIIILLVLFSVITGRALDYDSPSTPTPATLLPRPTPVSTVTHNTDWQLVIQRFDGVYMALVPPGCFLMGSDNGYYDEKPVHQVCFDLPFWIDRTEVTNAQFKQFGAQAQRASHWTDGNRPREQVTWFEARDLCTRRGMRLPTEAEWEYAARGPDSLIFPWGNEFAAASVVSSGNSGGETAAVGSTPDGASWVGALDLSGNVWEWTGSIYDAYPYQVGDVRETDAGHESGDPRVLRGGSWFHDVVDLRATRCVGVVPPDHSGDNIGFRCARSSN